MEDSGSASSPAAQEYVRVIDELIARPFPASGYHDEHGHGGPEHHVRILRASEDFWDDDDGAAAREAHTRLEAELSALTVTLTARWGEPRPVDLDQYWPLARANKDLLPQPLSTLRRRAASMRVWPLPGTGRWLALAIGQEDKELPFELLAAIGVASALVGGEAGQWTQAGQALGPSGSHAATRDLFALIARVHQDRADHGSEHPITLVARAGVAYWTGMAGDAAGARDQYAVLLPIHERVLGHEHLDTLIVRGNLARWTGEAGDVAGARDQFAALLPVSERVVGQEHPITVITRGHLARWTARAQDAG
jgi:hypothetical protein